MSKDLLLEGAVAGHMNHIYDNGEMTFGELKQLLQAAADGDAAHQGFCRRAKCPRSFL